MQYVYVLYMDKADIKNSKLLNRNICILEFLDFWCKAISYNAQAHRTNQSEQHSVSSIKHVLVYKSIIIYFTDLFNLYIFIQNVYANKKVFDKKGWTNYV